MKKELSQIYIQYEYEAGHQCEPHNYCIRHLEYISILSCSYVFRSMKYLIVVFNSSVESNCNWGGARGAQQTSPSDGEAEQPTAEISGIE